MRTSSYPEIQEIAGKLGLPVKELKRLALNAGMEAIAQALQRDGEVTFPLNLHAATAGDMLPIWLPSNLVLFLRELCEAADIEDGANGYVLAMLEDDIENTTQSSGTGYTGVIAMISEGWVLTNRAEAVSKMLFVAQQWEKDPNGTVKRKSVSEADDLEVKRDWEDARVRLGYPPGFTYAQHRELVVKHVAETLGMGFPELLQDTIGEDAKP